MMKRRIVNLVFSVMLLAGLGITAQAAPKQMPDGNIFDAEYYAQANPDVVAVFGTDENLLYQHWLTCGQAEGRLAVAPTGATTVQAPVSNTSAAIAAAGFKPGDKVPEFYRPPYYDVNLDRINTKVLGQYYKEMQTFVNKLQKAVAPYGYVIIHPEMVGQRTPESEFPVIQEIWFRNINTGNGAVLDEAHRIRYTDAWNVNTAESLMTSKGKNYVAHWEHGMDATVDDTLQYTKPDYIEAGGVFLQLSVEISVKILSEK